MESFLKLIQSTPVPVILIVAGIFFLLLAITGGISGNIKVAQGRQNFSGAIGILLLLVGFTLYLTKGAIVPEPADKPTPQEPLSKSTEPPTSDSAQKITPRNDNLPYFMTRRITERDIEGKSAQELEIMRNEIFARHGMIFSRPELRDYFNRQSWYVPSQKSGSISTGSLNPVEQENIHILKTQESLRR